MRALVGGLLLALLSCGPPTAPPVRDEASQPEQPAESTEVEEQTATIAPLQQSAVEIYFPSAEGDGLVGEFREIFNTATPGDRAKQIIADLISGPSTPEALRAVPPGTRLRQVYVLDTGTAYVDFSSELAEGLGGGSTRELLTVYSIIDSVALGVGEISRVGILINGQPLETLNGHLDLRRPLPPDFGLILGSIVVRNATPQATPLAAAPAPIVASS